MLKESSARWIKYLVDYFSHTALISFSFTTTLFMFTTPQTLACFSICFEGFKFLYVIDPFYVH